MLTLTFLGVGSAFAKRNFQSNALIEAWSGGPDKQERPDDALLIDFGATGPTALHRLKDLPAYRYLDDGGAIRYGAIRGVIVTHLHADHIGGLEEWALTMRFARGAAADKPQLFGASEVLVTLWERSLRGGLGVLDGREAGLEDYFAPNPVDSASGTTEGLTMLGRYELSLFRTDHIRLKESFDWPSFGVSFRDAATGDTALYSGDTRFDPGGFGGRIGRARIIFHEAQLEEASDSVHASLSALRSLPESVRRRMMIYHYSDRWDEAAFSFVEDEFAGFARAGQRYVLFSA